jgi:hypothetical protein
VQGTSRAIVNADHFNVRQRSMIQQPPLFQVIVGFALFVTFTIFCICFASLRNNVDGEKLRMEPDIAKVFSAGIPPDRVLTDKGRLRVKICKVTLIASAIEAAALVALNLTLGGH